MKISERKVQEIGKSLLISLPKEWTTSLGVEKGMKVQVMIGEQGSLSIAPEFVEKKKQKEVTIRYDEHFQRRFFREYFDENEKITVRIDGMKPAEKKGLYIFIRRFMNTQIIEETRERIVIKCFRIEELSMSECVGRMFFLSLNMMDEIRDKEKMQELRDTMTRFYYMVVMQIRRFLSEGKYTKANQIPLILAMDMRMVAEKIQRIGELLCGMDRVDTISLQAARDYYRRSVEYFLNGSYEKALPLWHEYDKMVDNISRTAKAGRERDTFLQIVRYAKEISMLVR